MDLTESWEATIRLLDEPWAWRQRVTEEIELASARHARVTATYQVELSPAHLSTLVGRRRPTAVRVLLPVTTRPKGLLFRLQVAGPDDSPALLLRRIDIAAFQAEYLTRLVLTSNARHHFTGLPEGLFEALSVFTPALARHFDASYRTFVDRAVSAVLRRFDREEHSGRRSQRRSLAAYLTDGLGLQVGTSDVGRWFGELAPCRDHLAAALGDRPDRFSSSENILWALPRLDRLPESIAVVDGVVRRYAAAVAAAERLDDRPLLRVLAEYGRRWEVIIEAEVPQGRPSTAVITEDRPQRLSMRSRCRHDLGLNDAPSYHVEVTASAGAVEIASARPVDRHGRRIAVAAFDGQRMTPELCALYASDPDRADDAQLRIRLRPAADVRWPGWLFELLAVSAAGAAWKVEGTFEHVVAALALLVVPTTLAAALLSVRAQTPLAARVQRWPRRRLLVEVAVLWAIAVAQVLSA